MYLDYNGREGEGERERVEERGGERGKRERGREGEEGEEGEGERERGNIHQH